eukprot:366355-Chlamydomonas_euryale.AAC.10
MSRASSCSPHCRYSLPPHAYTCPASDSARQCHPLTATCLMRTPRSADTRFGLPSMPRCPWPSVPRSFQPQLHTWEGARGGRGKLHGWMDGWVDLRLLAIFGISNVTKSAIGWMDGIGWMGCHGHPSRGPFVQSHAAPGANRDASSRIWMHKCTCVACTEHGGQDGKHSRAVGMRTRPCTRAHAYPHPYTST